MQHGRTHGRARPALIKQVFLLPPIPRQLQSAACPTRSAPPPPPRPTTRGWAAVGQHPAAAAAATLKGASCTQRPTPYPENTTRPIAPQPSAGAGGWVGVEGGRRLGRRTPLQRHGHVATPAPVLLQPATTACASPQPTNQPNKQPTNNHPPNRTWRCSSWLGPKRSRERMTYSAARYACASLPGATPSTTRQHWASASVSTTGGCGTQQEGRDSVCMHVRVCTCAWRWEVGGYRVPRHCCMALG